MRDTKNIVEGILGGRFPDGKLTPDDHVQLINDSAQKLVGLPQQSEDLLVGANNLILWLGGLSQDLRCYGVQLVLKHHAIMFAPDEKSQERIDTVIDNVTRSRPYKTETFDRVAVHNWPKVFSNTLEERLEALADEVADEDTDDVPSVDMILTGQSSPVDLDPDNTIRLIADALDELKATLAKYGGEPNIVFYEKFNYYLTWLGELEQIELGILGLRTALTSYKLPTRNRKQLPALEVLSKKFGPYVR